jgi:hypothetical protein
MVGQRMSPERVRLIYETSELIEEHAGEFAIWRCRTMVSPKLGGDASNAGRRGRGRRLRVKLEPKRGKEFFRRPFRGRRGRDVRKRRGKRI